MAKKLIIPTLIAMLLAVTALAASLYADRTQAGVEYNASGGNALTADEKLARYNLLNVSAVLDLKKHYIVDFTDLKSHFVAEQKKHPFKSYLYFSYLNNSAWIGIGEREGFYAASLVKVPLAMAVYKAVEEGRLSLDTAYTITQDDLSSEFGTLYQTGLGRTMTLEELLELMLQQSDNTAKNAIQSIFGKIGISDPLGDVYSNLGWDFLPSIESGVEATQDQNYRKISVKVLSNMLLSLYNGSYINLEHSQELLRHLSMTPFTQGMPSGVPEGVVVVHKVGIAVPNDTYSDCGIVYAPNRNYVLCVGVEGVSQSDANSFIAAISKLAYDYVIRN